MLVLDELGAAGDAVFELPFAFGSLPRGGGGSVELGFVDDGSRDGEQWGVFCTEHGECGGEREQEEGDVFHEVLGTMAAWSFCRRWAYFQAMQRKGCSSMRFGRTPVRRSW